jgi:hypothetical protein
MFVELGQALMKRELWDKALDCFASINEEDAVSPPMLFKLMIDRGRTFQYLCLGSLFTSDWKTQRGDGVSQMG